MTTRADIDALLFRPVIEDLGPKKFAEEFEDNVQFLHEAVCVRYVYAAIPNKGRCEIFVMHNGIVVVCSERNRWSAYECEARVEAAQFHTSWMAFTRGAWTLRVPQEEGMYFVKDRELGRRSVRELVRVNGRLKDISGGFVAPGKVTTWQGFWWDTPIPALPESY